MSTDKVDTEIPSPYGGVLEKILVGEDETAAVGAELAIIGGRLRGIVRQRRRGRTGRRAGTGARGGPGRARPRRPRRRPPRPRHRPRSRPPAPAPAGGSGTSVTLPEMGESVTEGTVTRWLKAVGDEVAVDEPLVEVSTDKVDTEIPSPVAGTLLEITVGEDETIEVGAQLGVIGDAGAAPAAAPAEPAPEPAAPAAQGRRREPRRRPRPHRPPPAARRRTGRARSRPRRRSRRRRCRRAPTSPR